MADFFKERYYLKVQASARGKKPQLKCTFFGFRGVYRINVIIAIKSKEGRLVPLKIRGTEFNYTSNVVLHGLHTLKISAADIAKRYIDALVLYDKPYYYMVTLVKNTDDCTRPFILSGTLACGAALKMKGNVKSSYFPQRVTDSDAYWESPEIDKKDELIRAEKGGVKLHEH